MTWLYSLIVATWFDGAWRSSLAGRAVGINPRWELDKTKVDGGGGGSGRRLGGREYGDRCT